LEIGDPREKSSGTARLSDAMDELQIILKVNKNAYKEGKHFLSFLRVGAKGRGISMSITANNSGAFKCSIPAKDQNNFDLFLQELMLNQGLYYFLCGVQHRRGITRSAVKAMFQELLDSRFQFTNPRLLQWQLLKGLPSCMAAGEFSYQTGRLFEMFSQQFKLGMISGYDFIRNLDDLLTEFMLSQLEHGKGKPSPTFSILVDECGRKDILRDEDIRKVFNQIHSIRTRGLHRLEREIPNSQLSQIDLQVGFFFQYLDDYFQAQAEKTVELKGKRYRRIRYGNEIRYWKGDAPQDVNWDELFGRPCHDCFVVRGEFHVDGCDMEVCPRCKGQYLGCECRLGDEL
jgi:hypothetical protein